MESKRMGVLLRALGLAVLAAAVLNVILAFRDAWEVKRKVDRAERTLAQTRERNIQARRQIRSLQTSPRAVDNALRDLHHYLDPGEQVVEQP
jgi:cell division protein FtsB